MVIVDLNEHAMVLGNLLQKAIPSLTKLVDHPLKPEQIFYAGLQEPNNAEKVTLPANGLEYQHHQRMSLTDVKAWIKENNIQHLYIHFDIDVLSPQIFMQPTLIIRNSLPTTTYCRRNCDSSRTGYF